MAYPGQGKDDGQIFDSSCYRTKAIILNGLISYPLVESPMVKTYGTKDKDIPEFAVFTSDRARYHLPYESSHQLENEEFSNQKQESRITSTPDCGPFMPRFGLDRRRWYGETISCERDAGAISSRFPYAFKVSMSMEYYLWTVL